MQERYYSEYMLKRFDDDNDMEFIEALALYAKYMPEYLKTSTNEIVYFLTKNDSEREMMMFGLYYNQLLVGYMQLAYFPEKQLLFLDYIVLKPEHRKNHAFSNFLDLIEKYVREQKLTITYLVTEVMRFKDIVGKIADETGLIGRFELEGFYRLDYPYWQLPLGNPSGKNIDAVLLVKYFNDDKIPLSLAEYADLLETIFKKHYLKWYSPFLTEHQFEEYCDIAEKTYNQIVLR